MIRIALFLVIICNKEINIMGKKTRYAFHVGTTNKSPTFFSVVRSDHWIFERWLICERFIFRKKLLPFEMKIIIDIDFYLLSLFNILEWFIYIVYPDLYFCIYILFYMYTPLYCIMCCYSLFSLHLCTYIRFESHCALWFLRYSNTLMCL